jgi:hypothetical protein
MIVLSKKVSPSLLRIAEECVVKAVNICASKYKFSTEEALNELGVMSIEVGKCGKKTEKKNVVSVSKPSFPLPYNGEKNAECCSALRQNNGLYTQCPGARRGESNYCKGCEGQMQKKGAEVPEYGTIEMRKAVGIFEYVDPKGRKPVAYTKVMKKLNLTKEQVLEEAKKLNIEINEEHFKTPETEGVKRGRPKTEKEPKEKGTRGRPKKSKKVVEIEGDTDDLFATLVANANEDVEPEEAKSEDTKSVKSEESSKAAKEAAKEATKKEKEGKLAADKAAKEAAKEAEKAAKAQEKAAKEAAKEAEKAAKEAAKAEKEAAKEAAKAEKEAAKEAAKKEKEAKLAAKASKAAKEAAKEEVVEEDEEPDVVKKIEFEGKKYLKSKKTGIIYDYNEYTKNGEQVVVGKWNEASNKIDFTEEEEAEEDYEA